MITIGNIRRKIIQSHKNGRDIDFNEAFNELNINDEIDSKRNQPNFYSWHYYDNEKLRNLVDMISVEPFTVNGAIKKVQPRINQRFLKAISEVQISLEMPYSPVELSVLDDYVLNLYVWQGICHLHLENRVITLNKGDFLILTPSTPCYVECGEQDQIFNIILRRRDFQTIWKQVLKHNKILNKFMSLVIKGRSGDYLNFTLFPSHAVQHVLQVLLNEFVIDDEFSLGRFLNALQGLYVLLLRSTDNQKKIKKQKGSTTQVVQIVRIMQQEFATITLEDLSNRLNYNSTYLSRIISNKLGKSFSELLIEIRLNEAKNLLLKYPDWRILKISQMIGYQNPEYFATLFKKEVGCSPTEYRRENKK